ncbi:hypothetical protein K2173_015651 [Erythroxylum novogranatense]|uniref:PITH domain-containing protein n=1 Tax=Erythroxylum novogranatense TaxID=1862640 RepID=A0AAV8SEM6_9ROSI|nr:hypothetical protein K2173_015651 [Erythroxylum novogranatense]
MNAILFLHREHLQCIFPNSNSYSCYREDDALNLGSDADEQLLIYIPFLQVVKLFFVVIKGPEEEGICKLNFPYDASMQSSTIREKKIINDINSVRFFYCSHLDFFSNVNDFPPSDTVVLSSDDLKGKLVVLKYVKFHNVRSLTVFIEDNQSGSEITKVQKIALFGTTHKLRSCFNNCQVMTTDMKENL